MADSQNTLLITGVAGNLGLRLLQQLADFRIVGVDLAPPATAGLWRFESLDLGEESSCDALVALLRESQATAVVHLAFVIDPLRTGVLDLGRMWQINVSGTARVMEAIAETNRMGGSIKKFIFPSSVSAYGSDLPRPVDEGAPLQGHTLAYAIHKRVADEVVRGRAEQLGECRTYLLRPHIFVGASMQNYLVGALRGTPTGKGPLAAWLRRRGTRLPLILPRGGRHLQNKFQFVHVDDMARLMAYILREAPADAGITVMNVAGRGESLSFGECARIAHATMLRLPTRWLCRLALRFAWDLGISGVPPDSLPYIAGSYTMDTRRLNAFLGDKYEQIIQHTIREALVDSFAASPAATRATASAPSSVAAN